MKHYDRATNNGEVYVQNYPHLAKWINQCLRCQKRGLKPETPNLLRPTDLRSKEFIEWHKFKNLRKYFATLALDADGLCATCK
jgi:hypothetical protein